MSTRMMSALRLAAVAAAGIVLVGCAEKTLSPNSDMSPRFTLRLSAATPSAAAGKKLAIAAVYFSSVVDKQNTDSFRILDTAIVPVTGAAQDITLKIDITQCLADPTRRGSHDACSISIGAFLEPDSMTSFDKVTSSAYDFALVGPFDVSPGHPPVIPPIDLNSAAFVVNHWESDAALQLGGNATPQFLSGPLSGAAASGTAAPTLFALTNGPDTSQRNSNNGFFSNVAQLAVLENGTWRRVNGPQNIQFNDVAAFAPNDVYIAGSDGLYHYDGTSITAVSSVRDNLRSIAVSPAGSGARFIIAGNNSGGVWFGSPSGMSRATFGASGAVDGVCVTGANEAFALTRSSGNLYRFDGTAWTATSAPFTGSRTDLQCPTPGVAFVFSQGSGIGSMLRWNGSGWTSGNGPSAQGRSLNWAVVSPNEIYAAGDSSSLNRAFYRFDGSTWREIGRTSFVNNMAPRPWADPRGGAYYGSSQGNSSRVEFVNGTSVRVVSYRPSLRDATMPTTSSAFVVGSNMLLARLNGTSWSVDAPPAGTPPSAMLQGVWADSPSNAWAVGTGSTIVRWDGTRWTTVSDARRPIGPADSYNAVWGAGNTVWVAGDLGVWRCQAAGSCSQENVPVGNPNYGIAGTSASNIYLVGSRGRIFHYDGSAWTSMSSPTTGRLTRLLVIAPNNIWAVGDTVIVHYDGTNWTSATQSVYDNSQQFNGYTIPQNSAFEIGAWVAGPKEAYISTFYGSIRRGPVFGWDEASGPFRDVGRITAIAGASGGCAIAVAEGSGLYGPQMLRGVGPTGCFGSTFTPPAAWP